MADSGDKLVIAWVIVAEGGNPAYPGFSAVGPKMVPWVFYFDLETVLPWGLTMRTSCHCIIEH